MAPKAKVKAKSKASVKLTILKAKSKGLSDPGSGKKPKGFPPKVCPLSKSDFIKHAAPTTFEIDAKPATFGPGGFGWKWNGMPRIEADGPDSTALGDKVVRAITGCNFIVMGSKQGTCGLTAVKFKKEAVNLKKKLTAEAYEFSTGSFGWQTNGKIVLKVAGVDLTLQYNLNAVVGGSKPKSSDSEADPGLTGISPKAIAKHLPTLGNATKAEKDDLKKIKGIGPFIEKRLNHIQLYTLVQISRMTPEIENDVANAIVYFPGRQRRDKWAEQAKVFTKKVRR